jgi:hypothetical protein
MKITKRLKLTRADGQTSRLGDHISLRIVRASHGRAEMAMEVPSDMRVSIKESSVNLLEEHLPC